MKPGLSLPCRLWALWASLLVPAGLLHLGAGLSLFSAGVVAAMYAASGSASVLERRADRGDLDLSEHR